MNADDEALARLREADPARGLTTDLTALRSAVEQRIAQGEPEQTQPVQGARQTEQTDELAARRLRRSRRTAWLSGAAASVVVGVGGYLAGGAAAVGAFDGSASNAEQADQGYDAPVAEQEAATGASGAAGSASEDSATSSLMYGASRAVFTSSGLASEGGSAEAFGYDTAGIAAADTVAELAAGLGVTGDAVEQDGSWSVTDADGRSLQVYPDGIGSFSYYDPALDPWACGTTDGSVSDPDDGLSACDGDAAAPAAPEATARDFLLSIGVDADALELTVESADAGIANVVAQRPGVDASVSTPWYLAVAADGVYSAWGGLAPEVSLGSYAVISPVAAVERLMDPRFGASNGVYPLAATDGAELADDAGADPGSPGSLLQAGSVIPWPVQTYTIDGATLTLGSYTLPDGSVVLLPTWSLTASATGGTWTVVAVTDDTLDFTAGEG